MKRILLALIAVMLCATLFACASASPSGTYKDKAGVNIYEFSGDTVKITALAAEVGTFEYEMDGNTVVIKDYTVSGMTYDEETDTLTVNGVSFTKGK